MLKFLSGLCSCVLLALPLSGQAAPFAYIADNGRDCITAVNPAVDNPATDHCILHPGGDVEAIELLSNGTTLYVALTGQNTLQTYAPGFNMAPADLTTPLGVTFAAPPLLLAASPDSHYLWVGMDNTSLTRVTLSDNSTSTIELGFKPGAMVINDAGSRLYVAEKNGTRLVYLDLTTSTPTLLPTPWTLAVPATSLAINPAGTRLYAAGNDVISIRSTTDGSQIVALQAVDVQGVVVSGLKLYGAIPGVIRVWDAATTNDVSTALTMTGTASRLASNFDGTLLFTANAAGGWGRLALDEAGNAGIRPVSGRFVGPYPSIIRFSSSSYTEKENVGTTSTIKVIRSGDILGPASFNFETYNLGLSNSYAQSGLDYIAVAKTPLSFAVGESELVLPVQVQLVNDSYFGNSELFGLRLSRDSAATDEAVLGSVAEAQFSIENDDDDPRDRGGCTIGQGMPDPLLPAILAVSAVILRRRRKVQ